jgi:hypothetical protein
MAHDDISTTPIAMSMSGGKKMMMMLSNYLARIDFSALAYY